MKRKLIHPKYDWLIWSIIAVIVILAVGFKLYATKHNLRIVWGRSMYGTMTYLTLIHYSPATPTENSLGYFLSPLREYCVKRILSVSQDGKWLWMVADNHFWNGQDSMEYGWVSVSDLRGVVDQRWPNRPQKQWKVERYGQATYYPDFHLLNASGRFFSWVSPGNSAVGGLVVADVGGQLVWASKDGLVYRMDGTRQMVLGLGACFAPSSGGHMFALLPPTRLDVVDSRGHVLLSLRGHMIGNVVWDGDSITYTSMESGGRVRAIIPRNH